MLDNAFHFSQAAWLWGLLVIPIIFAAHLVFRRRSPANRVMERFADKELLPHLIKNRQNAGRAWNNALLIWSLAWFFGMMAMAGPQWRYTDVQLFKPSKDLVILLDLSNSMNATDVKPSRLVRAREEISDVIDMNHGLTIGLVAYAEIPHMVVPLTDDMRTIHNLLPSLDSSLITVDGDRLKPALEMASHMLSGEPGQNKSILVVSDGDFTEKDIPSLAAAARGAVINTMGVGTAEGAPITSPDGGWSKDAKGQILINRLQADRLQALSAAGHGIYVQAVYDNSDTRALLNHIGGASEDALVGGKTLRTWDEGFYIPALVLALLLLPWFRKGATLFALLVLLVTVPHNAKAAEIRDWFRNPAQQGQEDFVAGRYDEAVRKFSSPYQQGVAAYKAGEYSQAEALFKAAASQKNPNLAAEYNLGNALLMQNNPEDAIKCYETVLGQRPDDASAKHNLEIARKLLQQKQQQQSQQQSQNAKAQEGNQAQQKSGAGQSGEQKQDQTNGEQKDQTGQGQPQQGEGNAQTSQNKNGQSGQEQPGAQQNQHEQGQPQQAQSAQRQSATKAQQGDGQKNEGQPLSQQSGTQGQQGEQQQQAKKPAMWSTQERSVGSQQPMQAPLTSGPQAGTETVDGRNGQPSDQATAVRPRTQLDIDVDQWLNHIESDPGSFLKNQFMIEEQKSAEGREEQR